ncbi:MAG: hypothetical protein ACLQU3_18390 [Limisphaerales bacterium]
MITPVVPAVLLEDLAVRVVAPGAPADLAVPADLVTWAVPVDLVAWAVKGWAKAVGVLVR